MYNEHTSYFYKFYKNIIFLRNSEPNGLSNYSLYRHCGELVRPWQICLLGIQNNESCLYSSNLMGDFSLKASLHTSQFSPLCFIHIPSTSNIYCFQFSLRRQISCSFSSVILGILNHNFVIGIIWMIHMKYFYDIFLLVLWFLFYMSCCD